MMEGNSENLVPVELEQFTQLMEIDTSSMLAASTRSIQDKELMKPLLISSLGPLVLMPHEEHRDRIKINDAFRDLPGSDDPTDSSRMYDIITSCLARWRRIYDDLFLVNKNVDVND